MQRAGGGIGGAWTLTATWQLALFPRAPQYCGATPADIRPSLGTDTSSITQAVGPINGSMRSTIRRCTGTGSHVDWFTNCCRFCSLKLTPIGEAVIAAIHAAAEPGLVPPTM